ncbi:hypothetical protein Q5424_08585 [Conexibacter sp. JD483]|uniref:hypothetical protein n=1 Tax=unclassified Conexibacter TaxID=2627773 RepID=UPI00271E4806|nr:MULTISPECIES: hypothetical protein [unclassified Conexibacter]MDO8186122.1 hypothetical protein [Conexibacter sp. CPCC 205706]MDO8199612.1 hypothetical protein [Conexibacter sp. CPCC 205762]MDR9369134.1 hypothetical protein [Conexibacter sp. JD483]
MSASSLDPLYVEARRALLDALDGLASHLPAIVVVGAQAIYLHTGSGLRGIAPFTSDGDLVLAPALLGDAPALEAAMRGAGFRLREVDGHVEPGIWLRSSRVEGERVDIPVDLIVPDDAAPAGGRRGARLGVHGRRAARRIPGLEAALFDHTPMRVEALDPADARVRTVAVAGPAALLVAKVHKLADRASNERNDRLRDKDAVDVLRLVLGTKPAEVAATLHTLGTHPVAGASVQSGIGRLEMLFGRRGAAGVEMAVRGARLTMPSARVETLCVAYFGTLLAAL